MCGPRLRARSSTAPCTTMTFTDHPSMSRTAAARYARRRARIGASLLAVTLLGVAAATLSLVVVRQAIISSRANAYAQLAGDARDLADQALDGFIAEMNADPGRFLDTVLDSELPRVCDQADPDDPQLTDVNAEHPVYGPGELWPDACGVTWSHAPAAVADTSDDTSGTAYVRLYAPDGTGSVTVDALGTVDLVQAGRRAHLTADGTFPAGLATLDTLNLDRISSTAATLTGRIYSGGDLLLPTDTDVTLDAAQLAAENRIVGTRTASPTISYHTAEPDSSASPPIGDIRELVALAPSEASAAAAFAASYDVACPADDLQAVCIAPGTTLTGTQGTDDVVVSDDVRTVRITPGTTPDTITVSLSDRQMPEMRCLAACDPFALTALAVDDGDHPGLDSFYTDSIEVAVPASRVVASTLPTLLGACDSDLTAADTESCATAEFDNLTVLAGRPDAPQDLVLGSPVSGVGLAASGALVVSDLAVPQAGTLTIDGHVIADRLDDRVTALSASVQPARLVITGSLTLRQLTSLSVFDELVLAPAAPARTPWLPTLTAGFERAGSESFTAATVCGDTYCPTWP